MANRFREQVATWPLEFRDEFEERAAILEYDAGMARDRAESVAYYAVKKTMPPRRAGGPGA